jgi:hypothetical protein
MMMLLYLLATLLGLLIIAKGVHLGYARHLRRRGVLPSKGEASIDDVKRLLAEGREMWALSTYRAVNPDATLREAKAAIDRLNGSSD